MVGHTSLRSQKALLTRYCNSLKGIAEGCKHLDAIGPSTLRDSEVLLKIESSIFQLRATAKQVEDALSTFTASIDALVEPLSEEQEVQTQDYVEKTHEALEKAQALAVRMEGNLIGARNCIQRDWHNPNYETYAMEHLEVTGPKLPTVPVPTFSGRLVEFENFWALFDANIHSQPLSPLLKFNYLIKALRGEAQECVRRFTITADNYTHAINFLHAKYGDKSRLIDHLQMRLEKARAEKPTLEGQRSLLEYIWPTVTQLEERGVSLNGSFITQKILSKFQPDIQRKVLERRLKSPMTEHTWMMQDILKDLDQVIETEEQIKHMMQRTSNTSRPSTKSTENGAKYAQKAGIFCIFCAASDHKSLLCTKYASPEDRKKMFLDQDRCLNCGTPGHFTKACTKEGCRLCDGKKHHHTLCPIRMKSTNTTQARPENYRKEPCTTPTQSEGNKRSAHSGLGRQQPRKPATVQAHAVDTEACTTRLNGSQGSVHSDNLTAVLSTVRNQGIPCGNEAVSSKGKSNVLLLTGVAKVKEPLNKQWKNVELLLDTGADESFITTELANELGLECKAQKQLKVYTFGTQTPKETTCGTTTLELWDAEGTKHTLQLHTAPILMATSKMAHLSAEDLEFIAQQKISLSKPEWKSASKPQILVGCDQLWTLLNVPYPYYKLPSGLQLVPSKLGYLLTGRQEAHELSKQKMKQEITPTVINALVNYDEDLERWDKYWTLDSAGICEFTGTKNAEKEATNAKVAAFFEETIQKRSDGYYVRFPYKENHPTLPSNKAIALKRLQSVIGSLKNTPTILEAYDRTFKEQKEMGIIEEVSEAPCAGDTIIHYIPHQPVITPHKETTKLRIVFDASAHFRNNPSLNDVLHQGPLILPEVYAMLLRFRIPKYAIISDVEKAFLQIHLQETDRDATRFLWVKDLDRPIDRDNIVTLRFTRVTFGLNVSPYLLAGTIQHHLKYEVDDHDLTEEIRQNLYVDNLILSADTEEESRRKSLRAREIFQEMGMNLREFLSNDVTLHESLPQESYAKSATHKVLGINWLSENDCISITCSASTPSTLTKREVMRQIASIYDPLGWLVPLLMPAKKFQQDLWKQQYTWDAALPSPVVAQWNAIVEDINGFQKLFPRRFTDHTEPVNLAVFADASENAIAACAYIFNGRSSTLAMAKGKLPSVKTATTMPKLEMNAMTLAVRLAFSITQAVKHCIPSYPWTIYVFSDSQIALSWLSPSKRSGLGVLVTNRLREIRRIVHKLGEERVIVKFAYVNTSENPADVGTRGLPRWQLDDHIWWTGPSFLKQPVKYWYNTFYHLAADENTSEGESYGEVCEVNAIGSQTSTITELLCWERFSSLTRAKRVTAVVLRFIKRLVRHLSHDVTRRIFASIPELEDVSDGVGILNGIEVLKGRLALIRNHQLVHLSHHYRRSMENTLRLYKDANLLWRSKGRLGNAMLEDEAKSPFFIAPNTPLAKLVIHEAHGDLHRGIEHTIGKVREKYWVPKLRQQVRKLVSSCVKCRRFNALPYRYPEMTDLPHQRVIKCRPFQNTGLDFFDLPSCKEDGKIIKLYGCIFTCMVTRLIHIEVVRSMSTEEFINALRRFIARRGLPQTITCDNAPTFLLTENILGHGAVEIKADIRHEVANKEICWRHITPYAPWQGGFYERLIKSIKHAIYKTLRGSNRRSFDSICTFVAEAEASLNSRPLTYQGEAHEIMSSIRPVDFIFRDMTLTLPVPEDPSADECDPDYLPPDEAHPLQYRRQVIEALHSSNQEAERFWNIWEQQYLLSLRETHRRQVSNSRQGSEHPEIGDVVLVSDPILPRNEWRMGRIMELKRSRDGEVREAELLTSTKRKIRRPINLLIPLEIQEARIPASNISTNVTPPSDKIGRNDMAKSRARTRPYNLRPRTPKSDAQENVSEVEKQLHQAQTSLHKLKSAIPPLPEPNVLYEKIVELCTDHYNHTQAVTSIEEKVRRLRSSDRPSQQRITEISSINLEIDYISLQFRFCRSQLLTLFSLPPLLIAMDKMTKQHWETLMSQPREVSHNKPLIVDMDSLEEITSDQIQVLNSLRSTLNNFRIQAQNDADNEHFAFEKEVRDKLDQIQKLTLGFQDAVMDRLRERPLVANQGAGEGIRRIREENDIIRDNEGFIEGVMEMDESEAEDVEQEPDDQDSDDEDMDHNAEHNDLLETEDSEEERDEQEPEERESDDEELDRNHIPDDIPQREDRRRSAIQIEQEIRSAEQAVRNFEEILQQYEHEPLCPPRRFGQGHITKGYERFMKCAFCEAIGIHYSDSCTALRDPYTRRELIRSTGRCRMCLERVCARGATCRKYLTACYYCRERGHHSSLCDFPDQSEYIRSRLENAREGRIRSLNKLNDLRRELAYLGIDH